MYFQNFGFVLVDEVVLGQPVSLAPHIRTDFVQIVSVVQRTHRIDVKVLLPLLLANRRPDPRQQVDILDCGVDRGIVRQNFWDGSDEFEELFLGASDDFAEYVLIDNPKGELEFFDENPNFVDFIFIIIAEPADEFEEHRLDVDSLVVVIILDVDEQSSGGVLGHCPPLLLVLQRNRLEQVQLTDQRVRNQVVLYVLLRIAGAEHVLQQH